MKKNLAFLQNTAQFTAFLLIAISIMACSPTENNKESANPQVTFKTTEGDFTLELYPDKAPKTVENFLAYVESGFYQGTIFHRIIPNFMVQGGGFDEEMKQKETRGTVANEADNGLINDVGTVAMARTNDPHSASSQFFINLKKNDFLNHRDKNSGSTWGYCVFGKVIAGMDTINKLGSVKTGNVGPFQDVPKTPIVVKEVSLKQ